ncbi:MAG: serine hydroxymethyltransferase [Coriobacteriales bacterium]|jgi:glycine hydroxymethyltransferase|nr:serine hydroxymethyltransferase [Coriobacteriales bacterium]
MDQQITDIIQQELERERHSIGLIASENYTSPAVLQAVGSVLTNKYAEGYPGKRYYGGCEAVDAAEQLAIDRVCELYGCEFANVQPHSGASANLAVYQALMQPGDTLMGMSLDHGGHLTHGAKASVSGKLYRAVSYGVDPDSERIDMAVVRQIAEAERPQVIVAGASAYSRLIDFKAFAEIAHDVGAYLVVDMAHIAGLIAGGVHPSPFPYADVVTSTSHKTLRGPRGGFILTNDEALAKKINSAVFPGLQGGPLEHVIAGKAVAFGEALTPEFKDYAVRTVANAAAMAETVAAGGLRLVSGGTDNHLFLVDLNPADLSGKDAQELLESVGICANKNTIPNETRSPFVASGMRFGAAGVTTRGFDEADCRKVGELIAATIFKRDDAAALDQVRGQVQELLAAHPLYQGL